MKIVELAGLRFGEGLPKVCVPLVADGADLYQEAQQVRDLPADLFEWRIDRFSGDVGQGLARLQPVLDRPLLCTLRTRREGGAADLDPDAYARQVEALLEFPGFQLVDIEWSCGPQRAGRLLEKARSRGIGTVLSRHEILRTPSEQEMVTVLEEMRAWGCDLPKLAVTPHTPADVLALLSATLQASANGPVITMAMGPLGKLTRVSGELFGSCLTFGAGLGASAPGQLPAEGLRSILRELSPRT